MWSCSRKMAVYRQCGRFFSTQQIKEIPYVKGLPIVGTGLNFLLSSWSNSLHKYVDQRHKELGPVYKENFGYVNGIFIADPNVARQVFFLEGKYPKHFHIEAFNYYNEKYNVKRGLFFMDNEEWYHFRKIMNKHFLKDDITKSLLPLYDYVTNMLVSRLAKQAGTGESVKGLQEELYRHSTSFVLATAIGSSYKDHLSKFDSEVDDLAETFCNIFHSVSKVQHIPPKLADLLHLPSWKKYVACMDKSVRLSKKVLEQSFPIASSDGLIVKLQKDGVTKSAIVGLVSDLLMAAGDTSSYTTLWALYHLGKSREIQDRVYQQPDLIRGSMREALRLHSPGIFITRVLEQPGNILGYHFNAGDLILISIYTMGLSEANYKCPEEFWPERWIRAPDHSYTGVSNSQAYIPFAVGARSCIGRKVAEAQICLTLSKVLSKFYLDTQGEVDMILAMIPVPAKPIQIELQQRSGA